MVLLSEDNENLNNILSVFTDITDCKLNIFNWVMIMLFHLYLRVSGKVSLWNLIIPSRGGVAGRAYETFFV